MRERRLCGVPGCGQKNYAARGEHARLCKKHYTQVIRNGRLTPERERGRVHPCEAAGCERTDCIRPRGGEAWYCGKHARQMKKHGRLTPEREHVMGVTGCRMPGCTREHRATGYCAKHYNQIRWQRIKRLLARAREAGVE